jgi:hypothetical protein
MPVKKLKEKEVAEDLFVNKFWNGAAICEFLKLQPNTFSKWRNKGNWDKLQEETINNPVKMRRLIAQQMLMIAGGEKSSIDADALAKMYKVYEGMSEKINPGIAAAIIKLYDEYLLKANPELAVKNLEYNKKFLIHIINKNG